MTAQPPGPPEPPPIIRTRSTLPARYRRRRKSIWRPVLIGGIVGLLLSGMLLWYLGPRIGITPPGKNKQALKSFVGYQLGSNQWKVKSWGTPFPLEGYHTYDQGWKSVPPNMVGYPFEMERYYPARGWVPEIYVGLVYKGKAFGFWELETWFDQTKSPAEQRVETSLGLNRRGEIDREAAREVKLFEESLRQVLFW